MLDRAEVYELDILTDKFNKENRESWEQTRFIAYIIAQTQAYKKKYKMTDIIKFPWDDENKAPVESFEDAAERMKLFQQKINERSGNTPKPAKFN